MTRRAYVPKLRRNDMRRHLSELQATTVELPKPLAARVKAHAKRNRVALRTVWTNALEDYLAARS